MNVLLTVHGMVTNEEDSVPRTETAANAFSISGHNVFIVSPLVIEAVSAE